MYLLHFIFYLYDQMFYMHRFELFSDDRANQSRWDEKGVEHWRADTLQPTVKLFRYGSDLIGFQKLLLFPSQMANVLSETDYLSNILSMRFGQDV